MPNYNTDTGLPFGVISFNRLAEWCNQDLFFGDGARDLSYEEALEGLKAEAKAAWAEQLELAEIAAAETDPCMGSSGVEHFIDRFMADALGSDDEEDFISNYIEKHAEHISIDEPIIEGTCDGVSYRISWLGGAPLLFVFDSPYRTFADKCSPCVPGACSLDSLNPAGFECYDVPPSWRRSDGEVS